MRVAEPMGDRLCVREGGLCTTWVRVGMPVTLEWICKYVSPRTVSNAVWGQLGH